MASAGDARAAAALVPRMVAVAHLLGENLPVRVGPCCTPPWTASTARSELTASAPGSARRWRRPTWWMTALDEAIAYGEASRAESQRLGDEEAALNTAATLGSVLVFAGRMEEGWRLLEDAIARATGGQQEAGGGSRIPDDRVVRVGAGGVRPGRAMAAGGYRATPRKLSCGNHRHYMASHLAHVQWATGQWQAARPDRAAGPGRRTRRHHHPDHRAVRPRLPGAGARRLDPRRRPAGRGLRSR